LSSFVPKDFSVIFSESKPRFADDPIKFFLSLPLSGIFIQYFGINALERH